MNDLGSAPATQTGMTPDAILELAREFMAAVSAGDERRLREIYADDATIWHTFDCVDQDVSTNLRLLRWTQQHVKGVRYEELRWTVTTDGFVQQHVMRADDPVMEVPCMARVWCRDGRITRLEEYLDRTQYQPFTDLAAGLRGARSEG
jgi:ketosteroid isomerase-like protein